MGYEKEEFAFLIDGFKPSEDSPASDTIHNSYRMGSPAAHS